MRKAHGPLTIYAHESPRACTVHALWYGIARVCSNYLRLRLTSAIVRTHRIGSQRDILILFCIVTMTKIVGTRRGRRGIWSVAVFHVGTPERFVSVVIVAH